MISKLSSNGMRVKNCVKFDLCALCCCCGCTCRNCSNESDANDKLVNEERDVSSDQHLQHITFEMDSQYGMIVTKLELCIIFGVFAPYLLLSAMAAIISNYYCYKHISTKEEWKITNAQYPLPCQLLIVAIIIEQILACIFVWNIFENEFKFALFVITAVVDFAAVMSWLWSILISQNDSK